MTPVRSLVAMVCLIASALPVAAWAQTTLSQPASAAPGSYLTGYYSLNAGGNLFRMPDLDAVNAAGELVKMPWAVPGAAHSSNSFGAALTLWGHGMFAAEFDVNYTRTFSGSAVGYGPKIPLANGNTVVEAQKELLTNLLTVTASGIVGPWFRAGSGHVRPYLACGGGILRSNVKALTNAGSETYDTRTHGIVEVGGGLLWLFTPRVGVRGDVRGRAALMEPESVPWWTYVRSTIGLTVAF